MAQFLKEFLTPTKTVYSMWIIMAAVLLFAFICTRNMKEVPGTLQNVAEMAVSSLYGLIEGIMGKNTRQFFPLLGTYFVFIVVCNYTGFIPGAGEFFTVPTSVLAVTAALAIIAFFSIHGSGMRKKGIGGYLLSFLKPTLPIMLLELVTRPMSLALRLYGNIYGEELVTDTLFGIFPILLPVVMQVLSLLFCLIQAMIFTMLLGVFISEAVEDEEEE